MKIVVTIEILDEQFKSSQSDVNGLVDAVRYELTESLTKGNVYGYYDVNAKHHNWYIPENKISVETID